MKSKILLLFIILVASALAKFVADFSTFQPRFKNKVYPRVFIDGTDFGGKRREEIKEFFAKKSQGLKAFNLTVIFEKQPVATFSASDLALHYDGETVAEQAYMVGRSKYFLSRYYQILSSFFNQPMTRLESIVSYNDNKIKEFLERSEDEYNYPAQNALFKFEGGRVVSFKKEKNGREIEAKKFKQEFDRVITKIKTDSRPKTINLAAKSIAPEVTLAQVNDFGIEEEIAVGKSDYSHSIPERIHNVILAASKFDGVLIPPGETFSFNKQIGDISALTGYKPAYIIKEGKTVLGDGGGVCQVSTTLFRAAINAGLPVAERTAHAYRVSYYENDMRPGFDATVFSPPVDLKIKNDTPAYILIDTEVDENNNLLYFRFYGKKDDRKIEIGEPALWDVVPPPEAKYQDDPTLKKGQTKQVDFPAWGSKASFTYKVTNGGKVTVDEKFYSIYKPWAAVFLVGTAD